MNKKGFLILVLIILVHAAIVFAIVSQTDMYRFRQLKKYLNDNCTIEVVEIEEFESYDGYQSLWIKVDSTNSFLSLEHIASIYKALNEYAQLNYDKNFKVNSKLKISVLGSLDGSNDYAIFKNYNGYDDSIPSIYVKDRFFYLSLCLNTEDLKYIDKLEGSEVLNISTRGDPNFRLTDEALCKEIAVSLKKIHSLKEIYVSDEWIPIFREIDTEVDVY